MLQVLFTRVTRTLALPAPVSQHIRNGLLDELQRGLQDGTDKVCDELTFRYNSFEPFFKYYILTIINGCF